MLERKWHDNDRRFRRRHSREDSIAIPFSKQFRCAYPELLERKWHDDDVDQEREGLVRIQEPQHQVRQLARGLRKRAGLHLAP